MNDLERRTRFYIAPVVATDSHGEFIPAMLALAGLCWGLAVVALVAWPFVALARATVRVLLWVMGVVFPYRRLDPVGDWCVRAVRYLQATVG